MNDAIESSGLFYHEHSHAIYQLMSQLNVWKLAFENLLCCSSPESTTCQYVCFVGAPDNRWAAVALTIPSKYTSNGSAYSSKPLNLGSCIHPKIRCNIGFFDLCAKVCSTAILPHDNEL